MKNQWWPVVSISTPVDSFRCKQLNRNLSVKPRQIPIFSSRTPEYVSTHLLSGGSTGATDRISDECFCQLCLSRGQKALLLEVSSVIPWHPCRNLIQKLQRTPWDHKLPLHITVHPDTRRSTCNHKATGTRKSNISPLRQVQTALYTQLW